ncbi:hypothetical protein OXO72_004695 [Escherichia coli]|nr:hypothetical protein [Escherichia coli]
MSAVISLSEARRRKETAKEAEIASNWMWVLMLPVCDRYIEVADDGWWLYVGDNADSDETQWLWTRHSELARDEAEWLVERGVGYFCFWEGVEPEVFYNIKRFSFSRV